MMKKRVLAALIGTALCALQASAQEKVVTGKVTRDGVGLSGVSVLVGGTETLTQTNAAGDYSIRASVGQELQYRLIGYLPQRRRVGDANV
jgi:iron complex outermembrane receptor protein